MQLLARNLIGFLLAFVLASAAQAGGVYAVTATISEIKAGSGRVVIFFNQSFSDTECQSGSVSKNFVMFNETDEGYNSMYALLLSAFASNKTVNFFVQGCNLGSTMGQTDWPQVVLVYAH